MIVPMRKVFIACRAADRDALLEILHDLGLVHLEPCAAPPSADERDLRDLQQVTKALTRLEPLAAGARPCDLEPRAVAQEVEAIDHAAAEAHHRLQVLTQRLEELGPWGRTRLVDLQALEAAGLHLVLAAVPPRQVAAVVADCVATFPAPSGKYLVVAAVRRGAIPEFPPSACFWPTPSADAEAIAAEQTVVHAILARGEERLAILAGTCPALRQTRADLERRIRFQLAERGALAGALFAVQGWVPRPALPRLRERLAEAGVPAACTDRDPTPEETPPTLIRYAWWSKPIAGLFKILGSVAGYREADVSPVFIIALPIFCAMLISDAGYGALLGLLSLLLAKPIRAAMGQPFLYLMRTVAVAAVLWGMVTDSVFGFSQVLPWNALVPVDAEQSSQNRLMFISFTLAAVQLLVAWLWAAVRAFPDRTWLAALGWAGVVAGMYGLVLALILGYPFGWSTPYPYLLIAGMLLASWYAEPRRRLGMRLLIGFANLPLNVVGKFGDIMSYIRLMAIGMAGSLLATTFNGLSLGTEGQEGLFWPLAILVLVLGHGLNFALSMIALFAHGVRLNMLEFSTNFGMAWTGHAFRPFAAPGQQED